MTPMSSRTKYLARRIEALKDEGWTPDQIDALLLRLKREATRVRIAGERPSAGKLAAYVDPITVQTPALDVIDDGIEWALATPDARLAIAMSPQEGKALALDTPIATPSGWTTMGELSVGDHVYGADGKPCTVTWVSPTWTGRDCYEITTRDGERIVADTAHEWVARVNPKRPFRTVESHVLARPRGKAMQIAGPAPLDGEDARLPLDPYVMGVWLGDGHSAGPRLTTADQEVVNRIRAAGYPCRPTRARYGWTLVPEQCRSRRSPVRAALEEAGVLGDKRVPISYLRGSRKQRLALLQGLIDSDGYVTPKGQVEYCSTSRRLAEGVRELVYTLGAKAVIGEERATVNGRDCGPKYRVRFYLDNAAHIERKRSRCRDSSVARVRYVRARPVASVPTRCIEVDSPDHLFLAGRTMLPTHNSTRCAVWAPIRALQLDPERRIIVASYAESLASEHARTARNIIESYGSRARDPLTGIPLPDKLGLELADDKSAAGHWTIKGHRGGVFAAGVGGGMTGRPADLIIIDDPYKNMEEADSPAYRAKVDEWFKAVVTTRLAPGAPIILDRKSTRLNSSHGEQSRMPSSA